MKRTAAVIVTYNRKAMLQRCLRALCTQTAGVPELWVIDNASTDGTDEDMISMQFGVQETPTNYIIDEEDGQLMIRTTYSGKEAETQVMMNLIDGTDGIAAMEPFEGIYTAYGSDVYRYEFHADGSFYLILEENYSLDGNKVTLKAFEREFNYEYAENGGNLELSGDGTTIATLIPMDL